jgi:hypothetical protein
LEAAVRVEPGHAALVRDPVVFSVIITLVSFTSSPSNHPMFQGSRHVTRNQMADVHEEEDEKKNSMQQPHLLHRR